MAVNPKKHEMPAQDPAVRAHNFSEVALGYTQEVAIDEVVSSLGFIPKVDASSIIVVLEGKKIEFWNASNVVRAAGSIISFPLPVSSTDGHWWGDAKSVADAFGYFYAAIGKPSAFRWGEPSAAPQPPVQPKVSEPQRPVEEKPAEPAATAAGGGGR